MKKKDKGKKPTPVIERPVDQYFYTLDQQFGKGNKLIYALSIGLFFFGIMGLVWIVPFPQLAFLQKHNMQTFLNWGSFYIAIIIYLYLRLAPTLSYAMLFAIGILSFFIVQLEYAERAGGPAVWLVSLLFVLLGIGLSYFLARRDHPALSMQSFWRLLTLGPIWLWSKVFILLKIKY
ncbi:DUF962 domain-containing protein [Sphingobacterium griseoflavum]|uniref:DUF962 domain-containing protein n=1 Tax=Sphingobacterium griseoflavum TaxID=1474952 RepID=A0ABQ3HPV9_9SPHI|nr:hypothetical protein [Sphingobacterium griseoflavum]GHE23306.1 hypothetical protein GCM10017764_02740 [Sphingobacterium griseoflavum]